MKKITRKMPKVHPYKIYTYSIIFWKKSRNSFGIISSVHSSYESRFLIPLENNIESLGAILYQ